MICNCRLIINYKLQKRHWKPNHRAPAYSLPLNFGAHFKLHFLPPSCRLFILVLELTEVKLISALDSDYGFRERSIFCYWSFRKPTPNAVRFNSRGVHPPETMMHFPPCLRFPPYVRTIFRLCGKCSQFYLFPKNFSIFIRQNFWWTFFSHRPQI